MSLIKKMKNISLGRKITLKRIAKGTGEKAEQAKEMIELSQEDHSEEEEMGITQEEREGELDYQEEILMLLDKLPIKETDELANEDPIEDVRRTLDCLGNDELKDIRDELKEKLVEQNRTKTFQLTRSDGVNQDFRAKTREAAIEKAFKYLGCKFKKLEK